MSRPVADVAWGWAQMLGATQEAERLGHDVVDTRHLLLVVLAEPTVRATMTAAGVDLRDVQVGVGATMSIGDRALLPGRRRWPAARALSPGARHVLESVIAAVGADAVLGSRVGPQAERTPSGLARAQRLLAVRLLADDVAGDPTDGPVDSAPALLDRCGPRPGRAVLAAQIAGLDGPGPDGPDGSGRSRWVRRDPAPG